jgi:hypothetical protein
VTTEWNATETNTRCPKPTGRPKSLPPDLGLDFFFHNVP